jgi:hypothetical protein
MGTGIRHRAVIDSDDGRLRPSVVGRFTRGMAS